MEQSAEEEAAHARETSEGPSTLSTLRFEGCRSQRQQRRSAPLGVQNLSAFLWPDDGHAHVSFQPDPLHRADMGAKALGRRIQTMLAESVKRFRQNPLAWRFRDYRDRRE